MIVVSALSLSLRDKDRLRDRESLTIRETSQNRNDNEILNAVNLAHRGSVGFNAIINPNGAGGTICPHFFQMAISP